MSDPTRTKDLARIHLAKKELGLEDDAYRTLLQGLTKKASAADLTARERWHVLKELERLGARSAQPKRYPGRPAIVPVDRAALIGKIEAFLAEARRPWSYVNAIAWRMFKKNLVQDCEPDELRRLVAALNYDAKRHDRAYP
ncbi:MAG TPA: regulatory protein GemA [Holophaga sp.]|nr:regulatory protein GemA [Holophaga sp.]